MIVFYFNRNGARLDVMKSDDATPMHAVCVQGNLEALKLMFELSFEQVKACLNRLDVQDQSPLHKYGFLVQWSGRVVFVESRVESQTLDSESSHLKIFFESESSHDLVESSHNVVESLWVISLQARFSVESNEFKHFFYVF